jgi:4-hydroxy-4-methyl-2-oxoglutarate aldolase
LSVGDPGMLFHDVVKHCNCSREEDGLMATAKDDRAARFSDIYTGALTDVLYEIGVEGRTLPAPIDPLRSGMRLAGPAFTVESRPGPIKEEVIDQIEMLQAVPSGHVIVWATNAEDHAVIGDLAIAMLRARGCAGLVIDGGCRDADLVAGLGLPVFCRFVTPQDMSHGRGAIVGWGRLVTIGDTVVAPGDYVVADGDGVVVLPASITSEVLERAEAVVVEEAVIRAALVRGASWNEALAGASTRNE